MAKDRSAGPLWLVIALLAVAAPVLAASGTDLGFGYTWRDNLSGATWDELPFDGPPQVWSPAEEQDFCDRAVAEPDPLGPLPLGFAFPFYGADYSSIWISDNGWLSFADPALSGRPGWPNFNEPGRIPEAAGPVAMVAANWEDQVASGSATWFIEHGRAGGAYRVRFSLFDLCTGVPVDVDVLLFPDGRIKLQYRSGLPVFLQTIGVESGAEDDGIEIVALGERAPGRPTEIEEGWVVEFLPPPVLAEGCGAVPEIPCGTTAGTVPPSPPRAENVFHYCHDVDASFDASEAVHALTLAETTAVDLALDSAAELTLFVVNACDERDCIAGPATNASLLLGPGTVHLAVDGLDAATAGPYELRVDCASPGPAVTCGATIAGTTLGGVTGWDASPCAPGRDLSGPEVLFPLVLPAMTNLRVELTSIEAGADLDVLLLLPAAGEVGAETCLAWGDDRATAFDVPPGEVLVVVDGPAGMAGAFELVVTCVAEDLEPASIRVSRRPSECFTEHKRAWLTPEVAKVDLLLSVDLTASMSPTLGRLRDDLFPRIVEPLRAEFSDVRFGLVSHTDYPTDATFPAPCEYSGTYDPSADGFPYRLDQALTDDAVALQSAVDALEVQQGGDSPESYIRVLHEAAVDPAIGWRPEARRILVLFGDQMPHECNVQACPGLARTSVSLRGRDLGLDGVPSADDLELAPTIAQLADVGISLLVLEASGGSTDEATDGSVATYGDIWDCWATETGGVARSLARDGTTELDLAALVSQLVAERACSTLELVASPGHEDWLTLATPVYLDVALPDVLEFDVEICVPAGTPEGVHEFEVLLLCAGEPVASQQVVVTVEAPCLPETLPRVGETLRLGGTSMGGTRRYDDASVHLEWFPERALDPTEHVHVLRSDAPDGAFEPVLDDAVAARPDGGQDWTDADAAAPASAVWHYLVLTADACESEHPDDLFRDGG